MTEPSIAGAPVTAVDVHAHYLATEMPELPGAPRIVLDESGDGRIVRGDTVLQPFPSTMYDLAARLREMDGAGVSHQVLSPPPVIMVHAWSADPAYARAVNDSIGAACASSGGRLLGLGCVSGADPAGEVSRCREMGLRGIEIGTRQGEFDLDAPELKPLWAACEDAGLGVFVHPIAQGRGVLRRAGRLVELGIGMLADTAIAASALVLGGVLERHPRLRVALAHGCGAFPWTYPRLRMGAEFAGEGRPASWEALVRRLYADTLVFDPEHLRLLVHRLGANRVLLGSDTPYVADQLAGQVRTVDEALASGALPAGSRRDVLVHNALEYLGLPRT
ncbi:amidohydrolase family protein [Amycolatopsis sp. GM8]|uniref:amidohydrolase family protein n=1 Tax=Amycolatopsis sp. GM8 TaxID=2896530 RepID=UPI001F1E8501|nr:amidohydrolase family protein [Amycolatopsis sp. GM8]